MQGTTLTIRVTPEVKAKLERLAEGTHRTRSWLAGEAVVAYVERELAILEGIEEGLSDLRAGHTVAHEDAMQAIDAAITAAARHRA